MTTTRETARRGARLGKASDAVALRIPCPHCGLREYTEFMFGGELRDLESSDVEADFRRVYLRENDAGPQVERWFHTFGCRRWLTLTRDTLTNRIES